MSLEVCARCMQACLSTTPTTPVDVAVLDMWGLECVLTDAGVSSPRQ